MHSSSDGTIPACLAASSEGSVLLMTAPSLVEITTPLTPFCVLIRFKVSSSFDYTTASGGRQLTIIILVL